MDGIIPGANVKVLARAINALAKIGDDLFIEAKKEMLTLTTLNLRKTICVRYHLLNSFFSSYEIDENELTQQSRDISCKIHMKTVLPLLKGGSSREKDFLKLEYENNSDVIIFKMKFKCDDILMKHTLRLMDTESLTVEIKPDAGCNNILASSSFFSQLLTMFSNTDDEITLEVSKEKVAARNYIVGAPVRSKSVRSQVNLNASEFSIFQISCETSINFALRPFRTAIQFAESFNLNIGINFDVGGKPLAVILKNPTFEVNFIIATLNPYSDLQSSMATTSIPTKVSNPKNDDPNITVEDQEALLNVNWSEDFDMSEPTSDKADERSKRSGFQEVVKNKNTEAKVAGKRCKDFSLPVDNLPMEVDHEDMDVLPPSPESPRAKKAKLVFGRCFEPTFSETYLGQVLAPNSDSE
ncbi:hypothetical protein NQ315_013653 [Exocentrus adspersus]|uniref:Cell cycle checkpoint control protein n=1 Tax=Exocentrus adspersus TaxID=1586481 RepID=A0AAV8W3H1_9CUCU|nr:hypothetical protein NQ315_013653 [Exocentrus adspersus]